MVASCSGEPGHLERHICVEQNQIHGWGGRWAKHKSLFLYSTPQNAYIEEDQTCCPIRPPLSRSAVLPCPPSLAARLGMASGIFPCQCTWHMSSVTDVRKLTFLSVTDTYVHTYVHCKNKSLIQSFTLMRSATISANRYYGTHTLTCIQSTWLYQN